MQHEIARLADLRRGDRVWIRTLSGPRWLMVEEVVLLETDLFRINFTSGHSRRCLAGAVFPRRRG
ncbi:hypothetical protein ACFQH9_02200 [Pseudonocardia lutea]|uniref:Uncharacterized protein n=1 Tax=Pseudonocardia lutea TaxID=2172015 RepID=A0ABW1I460_9PSEU